MDKLKIAGEISSHFTLKGLFCEIVQSKDAKDLWSIRAYTLSINIPKKVLDNPENYPLIAQDLELLASDYLG